MNKYTKYIVAYTFTDGAEDFYEVFDELEPARDFIRTLPKENIIGTVFQQEFYKGITHTTILTDIKKMEWFMFSLEKKTEIVEKDIKDYVNQITKR